MTLKQEKQNVVSVFLGDFESKASFDAYLQEQYEADEEPLNQLSADYGLKFYDHDRQEAGYSQAPQPVEKFLSGNAYSASFLERVVQAAKDAGIEECNSKILLYDYEVQSDRSNPTLTFLGSFPYQK